jgi:glycosyltransferase involved in cell wall biosynthesis
LHGLGHSPIIVTPRLENGDTNESFPIRRFDLARSRETLAPFLETSNVAVLPLHALKRLPFLQREKISLVFDIYDPVLFELMEASTEVDLTSHVQLLNQVLRRGDFFICASERQRDFWLGALVANRRMTASATHDPELRALIDVVPFGIDPAPFPAAAVGRPNLTAAIPALAGAEKILAWPGGLWDWTDPEIVMKAMRILAPGSPGIHLVLFAGRHPTEGHEDTSAAGRARALANELQLEGRSVHFINDYVPYEQRGFYLAECDAAVSTHRANLESRFAYRTRLLDCVWGSLPIVCTEGDVLAEMIVRRGLGIAVPAGDAEALARAIERILTDTDFVAICRSRVFESQSLFDWKDAVEPLARFCRQPRVTHIAAPFVDTWMLADSAWSALKKQGVREALRRLKQHLRSR